MDEHPRREGTPKRAAFELAAKCDGQTVKTFRAKGGEDKTLSSFVRHGWAEVK